MVKGASGQLLREHTQNCFLVFSFREAPLRSNDRKEVKGATVPSPWAASDGCAKSQRVGARVDRVHGLSLNCQAKRPSSRWQEHPFTSHK